MGFTTSPSPNPVGLGRGWHPMACVLKLIVVTELPEPFVASTGACT